MWQNCCRKPSMWLQKVGVWSAFDMKYVSFGYLWMIFLYFSLDSFCVISFVVVLLQGIYLLHVEWEQLWRCKQKQNGKRELKFLSLKVIKLIFHFLRCSRMIFYVISHPKISFSTHVIQLCSLYVYWHWWLSVLNRRETGQYKHCWWKEECSDPSIRSCKDGSS